MTRWLGRRHLMLDPVGRFPYLAHRDAPAGADVGRLANGTERTAAGAPAFQVQARPHGRRQGGPIAEPSASTILDVGWTAPQREGADSLQHVHACAVIGTENALTEAAISSTSVQKAVIRSSLNYMSRLHRN